MLYSLLEHRIPFIDVRTVDIIGILCASGVCSVVFPKLSFVSWTAIIVSVRLALLDWEEIRAMIHCKTEELKKN